MRILFLQFCLFVTLALLVWDVFNAFQTGEFAFAALGQRWFEIDQWLGTASLNLTQAVIQRYLFSELWDFAFQPLLIAPAVLTPVGFALITHLVSYLRIFR